MNWSLKPYALCKSKGCQSKLVAVMTPKMPTQRRRAATMTMTNLAGARRCGWTCDRNLNNMLLPANRRAKRGRGDGRGLLVLSFVFPQLGTHVFVICTNTSDLRWPTVCAPAVSGECPTSTILLVVQREGAGRGDECCPLFLLYLIFSNNPGQCDGTICCAWMSIVSILSGLFLA